MKQKLLLLVCMLNTCLTASFAQIAYFVDNGGVRTFYYDNKINFNKEGVHFLSDAASTVSSVESVIFDASFANYQIDDSNFRYVEMSHYTYRNLKSVEGLENLNTKNVTDMSRMFRGCSGLTSIDVSNFDTQNVTNMSYMFYGCSGLTSIDVSNFDTKNVTNMSYMFYGCSGLTSIDVSNFDTKNVTDMSGMFDGCSGLTSIDVSKFDTQNVTYMSGMFYGCSGLTSIDVSNFDTKNVTDMSGMFYGCSGLTSIDVSNFDTKNVTDMSGMFDGCSGLTSIDVSKFDTQNVTYMSGMFYGCSGLLSIDVSNFDTQNVTNMSYMFYGCSGLTSIDVSNFDTKNVTDMSNMFSGCSAVTSLDVSNFDTKNVTNMSDMFSGCSAVTSLDLSKFDTQNVKDMGNMFGQCTSLQYLNISNFSRKSLENATDMFTGCSETMQLIAPKDWYIDDVVVTNSYAIAGNFIYILYQDHHADMRGIVNSLSGDVVIPATFEYGGETYNVKNVNSLTNLYYYDDTEGRYRYVGYDYGGYDDGVHVPDYTKVTSITFEDGIESISDRKMYAYWYCKSISIPKSVTYIFPDTYYMPSLGDSGYRDETRHDYSDGFQFLFNDITWNVDEENTMYSSLDGVLYDKQKKTLLRCPKIKKGIFAVPDGVEKIDKFAFYHCFLLTEIKLPSSVKVLGEPVDDYLRGAFEYCYSLEKINIPEGVERIEGMTFRYCTNLKEIIMPNSLKYYNSSALGQNFALETFDWQDCELETLDINEGYSLFDSQSICNISLPKYVKNIICTDRNGNSNVGGTLFSGGIAPEELTLPASIEKFRVYHLFSTSFDSEKLAPLKKLYVLMDFMPDIDEDFFGKDIVIKRVGKQTVMEELFPQTWADQCTLYVPENLVEAYKTHAVWGKFPNIVGVEVTREIDPIEEATTIAFEESDFVSANETPVDLNNTVVNDTYFSINNNSNTDGYYDKAEQCIVINKTTSSEAMQTVVANALGSADFISNYTGMVIEVNGKGSITISAQTLGNNRLAVKIGSADAKTYTQTEKGNVTVNYDVTENTYVYIYAVDADNQQQSLSMDVTASDNAVKVYSITVTPSVTAIESVASNSSDAVFGKIYSIDGKQLSAPQKGLNIIKMSDGTTRKFVR